MLTDSIQRKGFFRLQGNSFPNGFNYAAFSRRIKFSRRNRHPWRARTQFEESVARDSARQIRGHHGRERVGNLSSRWRGRMWI
jgi:hypothetical protein